MHLLRADLYRLRSEAKFLEMTPAARLNGTSDVPWERVCGDLFEEFPDIRFFDYTKLAPRVMQSLRGSLGKEPWPSNYHLTFSKSESNARDVSAVLAAGGNVAVVFAGALPTDWRGFPVVNGDLHDARFLDPAPCVIGLSAKGAATNDDTGFVVRTKQANAA